jgi:hypothetical protein
LDEGTNEAFKAPREHLLGMNNLLLVPRLVLATILCSRGINWSFGQSAVDFGGKNPKWKKASHVHRTVNGYKTIGPPRICEQMSVDKWI